MAITHVVQNATQYSVRYLYTRDGAGGDTEDVLFSTIATDALAGPLRTYLQTSGTTNIARDVNIRITITPETISQPWAISSVAGPNMRASAAVPASTCVVLIEFRRVYPKEWPTM